MAEFTENYNLEKPAQTDFYNVEVQNSNMEKIDAAIAAAGANPEMEQQVAEIDGKLGTAQDTGGTVTSGSVFAKLNTILQQFLNHWTAARAERLDNVDETVSSRASEFSLTEVKKRVKEIYNKGKNYEKWVWTEFGIGSTSFITVLSLTGKGRLVGIFASGGSSAGYPTVEIIIDETSAATLNGKSSSELQFPDLMFNINKKLRSETPLITDITQMCPLGEFQLNFYNSLKVNAKISNYGGKVYLIYQMEE